MVHNLASLVKVLLIIGQQKVFAHAVKHLGKINYVLGRILKHLSRQRSGLCVPYIFILPHDLVHLLLLGILNFAAKIFKQEKVEANLVSLFQRLVRICGLANYPVCYLCIEYFLTLDSVLVLESAAVFNEVMKNFNDFFRLQHVAQVESKVLVERVKLN